MNKPTKNLRKGGISGIIAAISIAIAGWLIDTLSLPTEYETAIAGVITAGIIALIDWIRHR